MKAQEFRIGNWVYSTSHKQNVQIQLLDKDRGEIENTEGIELTEEWLLRFGFENRPFKWNDGTKSTDLFISKDDLWCLHNFEGDWNFFMLEKHNTSHWITAKVNTVHQLQNLFFALIGSELELKSLPETTTK